MNAKKSRDIKQLKKQLDQLEVRVDKLGRKIKSLQMVDEDIVLEPTVELQEDSGQVALIPSHFSEEEVETAANMTFEAEEFSDMQEKKKEQNKRKKKKRGKH